MADYTSIFTGAEIDGRLAGVVADFDPGKTYYVGDFTLYENQVYRKTQNPGAGGFVAADWEPATIGDGLSGIPDAVRAWLDAHPEVPTTVQDGSITRQKLHQTLAQEITKHGTDIDVLDSRVDEILGLTPGSTTGDAQLADIKIGWDGRTYATPGDAVRGQISQLSESMAEKADNEKLGIEYNLSVGYYNSSGSVTDSYSYRHTDIIQSTKVIYDFDITPHSVASWDGESYNGLVFWDSISNIKPFTKIAYNFITAETKVSYIKESYLLRFVDEKADKAISLSGYGITDAYTKSEVDYRFGKSKSLNYGFIDRQGNVVSNNSYKYTEKETVNFVPRIKENITPYYVVTWKNGTCQGWTMWGVISDVPEFDEIAFVFNTQLTSTEITLIDATYISDELDDHDGRIANAERDISDIKSLFDMKDKIVTVIGDSISTNGATGEDANVAEITITSEDVGKTLSAYITYYDVFKTNGTPTNLAIGDHTFAEDEIGTEVSFVPTNDDIGKSVGTPLTYNQNSVTVWWEHIRNKLGCIMNPVCWSGSSITSHEGDKAIYKTSYAWHDAQIRKCGIRAVGSMERTPPDIILVYRGTNDMTHAPYTRLTENYGNSLDFEYPTTDVLSDGSFGYKEGLVLTISKLRNAYPNAKIFLCTLNVFKRVNYSHFPTNNGINTLPQYNDAIRDVANLMGCGVIEFDKCGITFENCYSGGYITDSESTPTHPSDKGHKVLGMKAITDLKAQYSAME